MAPGNPIAIIGTGGFGREVLELLCDCNEEKKQWEILGFVETDKSEHERECNDYPILGGADWLNAQKSKISVVIGVGHPLVKQKIVAQFCDKVNFPTIVHPSVIMSKRVQLAAGVVLTARCILTTNITVNEHVMINLASTVGHDGVIGRFAVVSPGANISGCVEIGEGAYIGTNATILEGRKVGAWSVIGAGAVVNRDIDGYTTAVGIPARAIKATNREP